MSEPVANAGKRPPGTLESDAGKGIGGTATLACDHLREDHRRTEAYLDRLPAVLQHLSAERIPEVQSIVGRIQQLSAVHFEKDASGVAGAMPAGMPSRQARMPTPRGALPRAFFEIPARFAMALITHLLSRPP